MFLFFPSETELKLKGTFVDVTTQNETEEPGNLTNDTNIDIKIISNLAGVNTKAEGRITIGTKHYNISSDVTEIKQNNNKFFYIRHFENDSDKFSPLLELRIKTNGSMANLTINDDEYGGKWYGPTENKENFQKKTDISVKGTFINLTNNTTTDYDKIPKIECTVKFTATDNLPCFQDYAEGTIIVGENEYDVSGIMTIYEFKGKNIFGVSDMVDDEKLHLNLQSKLEASITEGDKTMKIGIVKQDKYNGSWIGPIESQQEFNERFGIME